MPRVGNNPLKFFRTTVRPPEKLGAVVTHLPDFTGYHAGRLEVVQTCLKSMRAANIPILVWDNGSCAEFRDWLQNEFKPDQLILSVNMGKLYAKASIFNMVEPKTILAFSDDDILFYPGWLEAELELLQGFPHVGAVSGWPVSISHNWGNTNTIAWAEHYAQVERGKFILPYEDLDYCTSVGMRYEEYRRRKLEDVRITYHGMTAYACAQHCEFLSYAGRIAPLCEYSTSAVQAEHVFDSAIDAAGWLRLTTTRRYTLHMGNVIDDHLREEIRSIGL